MKISTFDDDLLGLKDFSTRLKRFIDVEHLYVEGGLVIGLNSKFGSGKSTFLQMWKSSFQCKEQEEEEKKEENLLVILLNAWESDYYGDPLFAIISALVDCIKKEGKSAEKIIDAAKDIGWISTAISGQFVKKFIGIDAIAASELAEKKKKKRDDNQQLLPDTFSIYEDRKKAMHSLKKAIQEFVEGEQPKILFLVDELDRCRPDYAISYLETIKHIFDIKGAVFLLAVDRNQLENSAKKAFGAKLDFDEYYRKFVHREVPLPDISEANYEEIALKYVKFYLERGNERYCFLKLEHSRVEYIVKLVGALKLTPRQIQEAFRILGHILETSEANKGRLRWCLGAGSILMSIFKIRHPRFFDLLGSQQLQPPEAFDFFQSKFEKQHLVEWWFTLCLTGGGLKVQESEKIEDIRRKFSLVSGNEFRQRNDLARWSDGWGDSTDGLVTIYEKIEQLDQWK